MNRRRGRFDFKHRSAGKWTQYADSSGATVSILTLQSGWKRFECVPAHNRQCDPHYLACRISDTIAAERGALVGSRTGLVQDGGWGDTQALSVWELA